MSNDKVPDPDLQSDAQADEDKKVRGEPEDAREVLPQTEPTDINPLED